MTMSRPAAELPRHPVRVAANRTGLSTHVLRAWERRYGAVTPTRTDGGQRLYSDIDLERLTLLQALTAGGAPISQMAQLPIAELRRLAEAGRTAAAASAREPGADEQRFLALRAMEALDSAGLRRVLERGAMSLGVPRLLDEVVSPLLIEIGEGWRAGRMTIAQEH
ncbi:MAG: MerR family transcriptional regulator, partial [Gemmatimonadota bacterium]|nr:MerR family transcriptional regulator [Gemmatimonadota bacterium]